MSNRARANHVQIIDEPAGGPRSLGDREREVIAALDRFRSAETKLDQAEHEYDEAASDLAGKLKTAGWPVMMVTRR